MGDIYLSKNKNGLISVHIKGDPKEQVSLIKEIFAKKSFTFAHRHEISALSTC